MRPYTASQLTRIPLDHRDGWSLLLIGVLAALTRFIGLGHPVSGGTPIFDEKHYVPQAWDIVRSWDHLLIGGIESNPGYGLVVHPPLAKQIIALAELIFGYSPWGWRAMAAFLAPGWLSQRCYWRESSPSLGTWELLPDF